MNYQATQRRSDEERVVTVRWHNHLPSWIFDDPQYKGGLVDDHEVEPLDSFGRLLLQVIADACDRPLKSTDDLDGAFVSLRQLVERTGASQRTVRRRLDTLIDKQFLVRKMRGGDVHMSTKAGTITIISSYSIPRRKPPPLGCPLRWPHRPPPVASQTTTGGLTDHQPSSKPSLNSSFEHNTMSDGVLKKQSFERNTKRMWRLTEEHLRNWRTVGALYAEAANRGITGRADDDALYFFTAAVHAMRIGQRNPCGLFNSMIRQRTQRWIFITQADERRGAEWYKAWQESRGYHD